MVSTDAYLSIGWNTSVVETCENMCKHVKIGQNRLKRVKTCQNMFNGVKPAKMGQNWSKRVKFVKKGQNG